MKCVAQFLLGIHSLEKEADVAPDGSVHLDRALIARAWARAEHLHYGGNLAAGDQRKSERRPKPEARELLGAT